MRAALAVVAAMVATTVTAALTRAAGVDLEVAGEAIPLSGVAFVTGLCSVVGVVLAVVLRRWFVQVAVALTALSLVPPVLADADTATTLTLVALHLVAAVVVIPALARTSSPRRTPGRPPATDPTARRPRRARPAAGPGPR